MRLPSILCLLAACASGSSEAPDARVDAESAPPLDAPPCIEAPCNAIYVESSGLDSASGTKAAPMKTINAGIAKAAMFSPPFAVFVRGGVYPDPVVMRAGVHVHGGFDNIWMQSSAVTTEINAASPAVTFDQINSTTILFHVTVKTPNATIPGTSAVAIRVTSSTKIELTDVEVLPGSGANGLDGSNGGNGAAGGVGAVGAPGREHSSSAFCDQHGIPPGGAGGASVCGRTGGVGGRPGLGDENLWGYGTHASEPGGNGAGGTIGGANNGHRANGGLGDPGASGGSGGFGAGGPSVGVFVGGRYMPASGASGIAGIPGNGGGGGGGGGGGTSDCNSTGSSGGGGGAGGCGGGAGAGGGGGGGSFGVVSIDSAVTLRASVVTVAPGGRGGRGGSGAAGGLGGEGGLGGPYGNNSEQDDGGFGAAGGRGGNGGAGGHGGGGGGGPSAAVVCVGTGTIAIPQSTLTGGTGGDRGPSPGNAGVVGVSTRAIGCPLF